MYETFFGLTTKPFELVPNPRFLYLSHSHRKAINYLHYGLSEGVGFILFTGEVGSGKTTILRDLIQKFKATTPVSVIFNTKIDGLQLLAMINEDFGLEVKGKDKQSLLRDLNDFLIDRLAHGMLPIIIIDEAQNLSSETLEEVRLLSNLESDCAKLVQIVLVGQPELRNIIAKPALLQLRQRIVVKCHLEALGKNELESYIFHRLDVAGYQGTLSFQPEVFDSIYEFSSGIPRLINLFCDYLLLSAFTEETRYLSMEMCRDVAQELAWKEPEAIPQTYKISEKSRMIVNELFKRLSFLQEQILELLPLNPKVESIEESLQVLEQLSKHLEQQGVHFSEIQESLSRIEEFLRESKERRGKPGEVIEFKSVQK
jgi:putative secretion ATPase (PEP-CTERM system associated)